MRRGVSSALLLVVLAVVLAPLALAGPASVPACCRADGKHHCMGMKELDGFRSQPGRCPYRVTPAVTRGIAALVRVQLPVSIFAAEFNTAAWVSSDPIPIAFDIVQQRGPPLS